MKISKATHKAVLSRLFFDVSTNDKGLPVVQPKGFSFLNVRIAETAYKKILEGSKDTPLKIDDQTTVTSTEYADKEIEFTPEETTLVKQLFDAETQKEDWKIGSGETGYELQDLFKGKE